MIYKFRWLLLIIFFTGVFILILPDSGRSVIRLNKEHGPSIQDLAGLVLMLTSWVISVIFIAKRRSNLAKRFGNPILLIMIVLYLFSIAGIIAGINLSIEWVLWICVVTATIINISFIISAFKVAINKR